MASIGWIGCSSSRWRASPRRPPSPPRGSAGRGNEKAADKAAVDAMRRELGRVSIRGTRRHRRGRDGRGADALHRREGRQRRRAPRSTSPSIRSRARRSAPRPCRMRWPCSPSSERGGLLHAPDMYMNKIAIGPGYPDGIVDLDASPGDNITALAKAKGVPISRDHRLHPRPAAPRRADQGRARRRRRRAADSRTATSPASSGPPTRPRPASTSTWARRRARGRAGGRRAALHRRADAGAAS